MILSAGAKTSPNNKGFTLIELLLVTTIIVVLIGLSTPLFKRSFSDLTLKNSTYNVSKLINYAWEKSIFQRTSFKISFDFAAARYQLLEMDDSTLPPHFKRVKGMVGRVSLLPRGVLIKGSRNEVVFYPDGHCDEARINVMNENGVGYAILLNGQSGSIEIKGLAHEG